MGSHVLCSVHVSSRFDPGICKLRQAAPTDKPPIYKFLLQNSHTKSIIVFGDSQGFRYFAALRKSLVNVGYVCNISKQEKGLSQWQVEYYATGTDIDASWLRGRYRYCYSCMNTQIACELNRTQSSSAHTSSAAAIPHIITVEFLSLITTDTTGILPEGNTCRSKHISHVACHVRTFQEFIFKAYLKDTKPDLVLLFTSFIHDVGHSSVPATAQAFRSLIDLMEASLPTSTKVMLSSTPVSLNNKGGYNHNLQMMRDAMLNILRHKWETGIKLDQHSNSKYISKKPRGIILNNTATGGARFYVNFDLYAMSQPVAKELIISDGIHFKSPWYDLIISNIFRLLCS